MRIRRFSFPRLRRGIARTFNEPSLLKLILRLILAFTFALPAFIFSEVIPDLPPIHHSIIRIVITLWFGLLGYGLFTDLARIVTVNTIELINKFVSRLTIEVMDQFLRLPRQNTISAPFPSQAPLGGVSVNQPLILDTSAIIDGRILDIAKSGFLYGMILLPTFVLSELQQVADSADYLKRSRGRRGFEIIEDLKKVKGIRIEAWDKEPSYSKGGVDDKLLKLAKSLHGKIITTDYNLNRVATVANVPVLNVNDLANAVKTLCIPGEKLSVKVVHVGKDPKQGVGYLPDGTMIVVENGADLVGIQIQTEVSRVIQVPAGRMIFTKKV
ncbi:hypothetical protein HYW46_00850 [Candidatus Daviesbacteria bacterium]|nr:hypothetical protein [Candidatus Daviesbacteria bacterium]